MPSCVRVPLHITNSSWPTTVNICDCRYIYMWIWAYDAFNFLIQFFRSLLHCNVDVYVCVLCFVNGSGTETSTTFMNFIYFIDAKRSLNWQQKTTHTHTITNATACWHTNTELRSWIFINLLYFVWEFITKHFLLAFAPFFDFSSLFCVTQYWHWVQIQKYFYAILISELLALTLLRFCRYCLLFCASMPIVEAFGTVSGNGGNDNKSTSKRLPS